MSKALVHQVSIAEYARVVYSHTPEGVADPDELLDPEYWANVAQKFKPGSRIEVLADDLTWFAEYIVISCGRTWAKVALLHPVQKLTLSKKVKEATRVNDEKNYDIQFAGQAKQYRVIRKSDKTELKCNLATEEEAKQFLKNHLLALSV